MRKVFLTGANGFLGRHIASRLKSAEGVKLLAPSRAELDLENVDSVRSFWEINKPDVLIHAAAFARGLGGNLAAAEQAFILNEQVIRSPLLAALELGVEKVIFVGTVAEYGYPYEHLPIQEDSVLRGLPHEGEIFYGLAKRMATSFLDAIRVRWNAETSHLYMTNMYGPGDRFDTESGHVVASMMKRFWEHKQSNARSISLWGRGSTTRDFLFAPDAAEIISKISLSSNLGHSELNVASGVETKMLDLSLAIAGTVGFDGQIEWDESKPIGIGHRSVSIEKLKGLYPFKTTPLTKGLQLTAKSQGWISK